MLLVHLKYVSLVVSVDNGTSVKAYEVPTELAVCTKALANCLKSLLHFHLKYGNHTDRELAVTEYLKNKGYHVESLPSSTFDMVA